MKESDFWLGVMLLCAANIHPVCAIVVFILAYLVGRNAFKKEKEEEKNK